jgi:hypothetical protein
MGTLEGQERPVVVGADFDRRDKGCRDNGGHAERPPVGLGYGFLVSFDHSERESPLFPWDIAFKARCGLQCFFS